MLTRAARAGLAGLTNDTSLSTVWMSERKSNESPTFEPKRHHYLPQSYVRALCNSSGRVSVRRRGTDNTFHNGPRQRRGLRRASAAG